MKKIVFFALVSVLLLNLAIASHGKALNQKDLPRLEPQLRRLIAKAGIKKLLAKDITSKMEGEALPKPPIEFGHTAVDLFSDTEVCMTMDFSFGERQGVLSLLFRWIGPIPILVDWSYWLVNNEVSDDIFEDTIWTSDGSPYYVTNPVSIHGGVTLTIGPGTTVRFRKFTNPQEHINLHVGGDGGTLLSQGADANPVTFTSSCDFEELDEIQSMGWESSDWESIQTGRNGNITVRHTILEYANRAINTWEREGDIIVSDSEFTKCYEAVNTWGWSSVTVTDNIISCWDAISVDFQGVPDAGGDIAGNTITTRPDSWPSAVINVYSGTPNISDNVIIGYHFENGIRANWLEPSAVIMGNTINILDWAHNGISVEGGECTISENEVTGAFDQGIGLGDFHGMVTSNTINSSDRSWRGINAWSGDCTISENYITGSFNHGIGLEHFHGVVTSNMITSSDWSEAGIDAWEGDCTISENEVTGSFDRGIKVQNFYGMITSNTITPWDSWAGIAAWGDEFGISDNHIEGYFDVGIFVQDLQHAGGVVSGNTIIGPPDETRKHGIESYRGEPTISDNYIRGDFNEVIRVDESGSNGMVSSNIIEATWPAHETRPHAIMIAGGGPTVEANQIPAGAFDKVICVKGESTATITNHCPLTGNYGVYCEDSEPDINNNDIVGNIEFGVYNETSETHMVNAENNWWGDISGPSGAGPGTGDAVSDGVDFDPWLPEPVCPEAR